MQDLRTGLSGASFGQAPRPPGFRSAPRFKANAKARTPGPLRAAPRIKISVKFKIKSFIIKGLTPTLMSVSAKAGRLAGGAAGRDGRSPSVIVAQFRIPAQLPGPGDRGPMDARMALPQLRGEA